MLTTTIRHLISLSSSRSSQAGYTLIELLVVIGLIGIISIISFNSLDTGNSREQMRALSDNLRTDLKAQEENALDNKVDSLGNPAGSYGILFGASTPMTQYSMVRLEKYPSVKTFDCTKPDCNTTVLSTYKAEGSAQISSVVPNTLRAIFFTQTSATPVFYSTTSTVLNSFTVTAIVTGFGNLSVQVTVSRVGAISEAPGQPLALAWAGYLRNSR